MDLRHFAAIDQGGSKTEALIFREDGEILAFADDRDKRAAGESYAEKQGEWIQYTVVKALGLAGLALGDLSGAYCALNGADWQDDYERLQSLVADKLSLGKPSVHIVNDCIGAMRGGAFDKKTGNMAVICLGSGANCAVRTSDGREYIYGYFFTAIDQGGSALGNFAWNSMLDAYNGLGDATILTQLMLDMYKQPDVLTMYRKITKSELGYKVYDFCPLLMRAAKEGDTVALRILNASGERMARYIEEGAKKLDISDETISLVLTGGVFKGDGSIFFDIINNIVQKKGLNIVCIPARYEPVAGTALLFFDGLEENERAVALRRFEASPRVGAVRYNK